jgi:hypothetical protein
MQRLQTRSREERGDVLGTAEVVTENALRHEGL